MKKSSSVLNTLAMTSALAMAAGMPGMPIIQPRKVKEPRLHLTEEEMETLASFDVDADDRKTRKENLKAKREYVRSLERKYADKPKHAPTHAHRHEHGEHGTHGPNADEQRLEELRAQRDAIAADGANPVEQFLAERRAELDNIPHQHDDCCGHPEQHACSAEEIRTPLEDEAGVERTGA